MGERGWDRFFAASATRPLLVFYEDLDVDLEGSVREVLDWIGASNPGVLDLSDLRHQRQASGTNLEWAERYRALRPDVAS